MKLRLPHKFQAALMAALASVSFTTLSTGTLGVATGAALLAGQQAKAAITIQENGETVTVDTSKDYNKDGVVYNATTGELTGSQFITSSANAVLTFTLDNSKLHGLASDQELVYVSIDGATTTWGFYATGTNRNNKIVGLWNGSLWNQDNTDSTFFVSQDELTPLLQADGKSVVLTANLQSGGSGTRMFAGEGTTGTALYDRSNLTASGKTITKLTLNKDLISSFQYQEVTSTTVSSGSWSKTYASTATSPGSTDVAATLLLNGRTQIQGNNGTADNLSAHGGDIVVGNSGQLFMQTWNASAINLNNDIYIGSSSQGDVGTYGVLRFGNDNHATTLNGNIYLIEDSSIGANANGGQAVNLTGTVTDLVDGIRTGSTLTIKQGKQYHFQDVDLTALVLNPGVVADFAGNVALGGVTLNGNASLTIGGTGESNNLGNVLLKDGASLNINGTNTVQAGQVKVDDQCAATITLGNDLSATQLVTIGANKTLSIASPQGATKKTFTTGALSFDNVGTTISLENVDLVVTGAATAGAIDHHNSNRGTMNVGTGATLALNGTTSWNTNDSQYVNVNVNGGTLTASGASHTFRDIAVTNGGSVDFTGITSTVSTGNLSVDNGATLKFAGANLLSVNGDLTLAGTLDVSNVAYSSSPVTLASYTGAADIAGATLTGLGSHEATLSAANNALTLTFSDTPVPPPGPEFGTNLGNVMYVGDSITHGVNSGSYRWSLFQILRDAGIAHNDCGPLTGNWSGGVAVGTLYGGESFSNKRTAIFGAHAYEISDTAPENCPTSRNDTVWNTAQAGEIYANTSINNWLGLSDTKRLSKGGGAYEGEVYHVDTFLMLIGTNDILTDAAGAIKSNYETAMPGVLSKLLGATQAGEHSFTFEPDASNTSSVVTIWKSMMASNSDAKVVFMSVPTLGAQHANAGEANIMKAVHVYNEALEQWCTAHGVRYVQSDTGIVDVSNSLGAGVRSMFQNDGTHPSFQGDLIFAGNIAKAMGYAGRTIGLDRSATTGAKWAQADSTSITIASGTSQTVAEAEGAFSELFGYTVDFGATYGNGAEGGWSANSNALTIQIGDGSRTGTLKVSEAYIMWGDSILYSRDNHLGGDNLRIAYVNSSLSSSDNVTAGYYVWLGDQLIGEKLEATDGSLNGITLSSSGASGIISNLSWSDTAYAPLSNGFVNPDDAALFHLVQVSPNPNHDNLVKQGIDDTITWTTTTDKYTLPTGQTSQAATLYKQLSSNIGAAYTGAANASYEGKIGMRYTGTDNMDARQSVLSVFNATVTGDVYMQFDNPSTVYGTFTGTDSLSVTASYNGNITGRYTAVYNAGIFNYDVRGGEYNNDGYSIGAGSYSYVNGGKFKANVMGGGRRGTINGGTHVTVTGGEIAGSVYGGGIGGTINGGTLVTITGGIIKGDVNGGGTGGTITGKTNVTIEGNLPAISGNISADNVTLKDVALNIAGYTDGFDYYNGTITGTDKITLDNYTVADMRASLVTKTLEALNDTETTIHNLHLTACEVIVGNGSAVTLADTLTLGNTATYSGDLRLENGLVINMENLGASSNGDAQAGTSGYRSATLDVMKLAEGASTPSLTVNEETLQGAGALEGFAFSYDDQTGTLSAAGSDYTTYYLEQAGDSVNLTTEQALHPELQHVVLNAASGTVEVTGTNTLTTASLAQNSTLTFDVDGSLTVSGAVSGTSANVVKDGSGTMTLNGNNTYSGGTTVNAGTLVAAKDNALGSGAVTVNSNGTLELKADGGMPSITGTGTVKVTDGDFQYHNQSFLEQFQGTVDIADGGVAQLGQATNKFANATLKVSSGGTIKAWGNTFSHDILLAGGTLADAGNNETYSGAISLDANSSVSASSGKTVTLSGAVTGNHVLETSGAGTVKLSATDNVIGGLNATASNTQIAGALTIDGLSGNGPVNVLSGGNLILSDEVTSITGTLNIQQGGRLTLGGYDDNAVATTGTLSLVAGSVVDVSRLELDLTSSNPVTLFTGGTITAPASGVVVDFGAPAPSDYTLTVDNNKLVLTFTPQYDGLIWDGGEGTWDVGSTPHWHQYGQQQGTSTFTTDSDVVFESGESKPTLATDITAGTMTLKDGAVVKVNMNNRTLTAELAGEGTYVLPTNSTSLESVSLGTDWTGAVRLSSTGAQTNVNLAPLVNGSSSAVEFNGFTGFTNSWATNAPDAKYHIDFSQNVILTDTEGGQPAFTWQGGQASNASSTYEGYISYVTGDWSGDGTFAVNLTDPGNSAYAAESFRFSGDIGNWNGKIANVGTYANANLGLIFQGEATEVNAAIEKGAGHVLLHVGDGSTQFATTFNNSIDATNMEVKANATATIAGDTTLDSITGSGAIVVDTDGVLSLTGTSNSYTGSLTMNGGATLEFAGAEMLSAGSLTLANDAILDLTNITVDGTDPITLVSTTGGITGTLSEVELTHLTAPEGYRGVLTQNNNNLVLTFEMIAHNLIWNTGSGNWDVDSTKQWHMAGDLSTNVVFNQNDNVKFETGTSTATLTTEDITAGTMTLDSGANLTLATGTNNLTTKDFVATGGASLVKNGTGAVHFGNAAGDADTLQSLTVNDGDISFEGKVTVTDNLSTDNATNDDSVVFNGGLTVNGTVNALHGDIVIGGTGESSIKNLDISRGGGASNATLTVKDGASLSIGSNMWMGTAARIVLEDGSVKLLNKIQVSSLESGESTVTRTGGEAHYSTEHNEFVITNAAVTSLANATIGNKLVNSTLTSAHDVTLSNAANSLTSTTVTANTLTVSAGMDLGAVTVNDGATLALTSSSPVTIGSGTIAGTLSLANPSQFSVNDGVFTFASGSTLDLSSLSITEGTPVTLATATGSGSFSPIGLRGVELDFGEQTYENARLAVEGNSLVLTFVEPGRDLIWQGGPGEWDTESDNKSWYLSTDTTNKVAFEDGDNVTFMIVGDSPVTIGEPQITAGSVTIDAGVNVTLESEGSHLDANEITVDGNLTVRNVAISADSMVINEGGHATANVEGSRTGALATDVSGAGDVTKMGTGNLALTGDNSGFTGTLTIEQGTVVAGSAKALGDTPNVVLAGGNLAGANGVTVAPTDDINITSTQSGTISANMQVAEGATLTFNTDANTTITDTGVISGSGSIVKDGTGTLVLGADNTYTGGLDINHGTVLVSNVGALGGEGSQRVNVSDGGYLEFDSAVRGTYTADYIALDRGSTLTFAGTNQLDIGTLHLTAASAVDLSNITVDNYGSYVLADVGAITYPREFEHIVEGDLVQFISMVNFNPKATETWSFKDNDLISLHYKDGQLVLEVNPANTPAFYWKPSNDSTAVGSWNTSDSVWYSKADFSGDTKVFPNSPGTLASAGASVYFLDAGTDGVENINLDIFQEVEKEGQIYTQSVIYVRDFIVAGGRYIDSETGEEKRSKFYFIGSDKYVDGVITMDVNRLSNFVVRSGTEAHFVNSLVSDGNLDVIHVCPDALVKVEDVDTWGVLSVNNEGEFYVDSDMGGGENIMGHVDNRGVMNINYHYNEEGILMAGQIENRDSSSLTITAPFIMGDPTGTYGDGILHNEGTLVFDVSEYDGMEWESMMTAMPILGSGTFATTGSGSSVLLASEVQQSSVELGAMLTELAGEVVTDATTVDAGATALFEGGGSLGAVTLEAAEGEDVATIQFAGNPYDEDFIVPMAYVADSVTAGTDSVFDVQGDATVTIGGYNADLMSDVPTGTIVVGDVEGEVDPAHLVVNGVTKVHTLDVQSGAADLNGNAIVSTLTQSGGTANFNAGGFVDNGTVSGGTLAIGDDQVLTLGHTITETGDYTVAETTGSINADALTLEQKGQSKYEEIIHTTELKDSLTDTQSGFLAGGEQYVKVFDILNGAKLTGNNVTVTHKDAAGPMTLISEGEYAGYGHLDNSSTTYTTYYVRDNYVTGVHGDDRTTDEHAKTDGAADLVKLSDIVTTADTNKSVLAAVVFDQTGYNNAVNGSEAYHGTLTVDMSTKADLFHVTNSGTAQEPDTTRAAINIAKNVVVLADQNYAGVEGQLDLTGAGVYQIDNRGDLGTNVSLLDTTTDGLSPWQGTVRLTGAAENVDTAPLSVGEDATASTIEFNQWTGSFAYEEDKTMKSDAKILLTGTGVQGDPAITLTEGDANLLWTNTVSGQGARIDHAAAGNFSLEMTGDTSRWNGTFNQAAEDTTVTLGFLDNVSESGVQSASVLASAGIMDVTYGGNVKTVNGDAVVYGTGDMNLAYTGTGMQVNSNISKYQGEGTLDITVGDEAGTGASATFNGDITADTLTVETNAAATLHNTTEISDIVEVEAGASLSIQNTDGTGMATITTSKGKDNATITGGVTMKSDDEAAIIAGTAGVQPVTRIDSADVAVLGNAASLQIENLVLADDTMVHGTGNDGSLVISQKVVQEMSSVNTERVDDGVVPAAAQKILTMTGTTDTTLTFENDKVANLDFASMCQMAQISGSAGTLVFDFTEMPGYDTDWEQTFSGYGFVGVNFNIDDLAINASDLTVKALTKDADGQVVERIGYYYNGGDGAVVGSIIYFQVPEPTTSTLSLLALAALAARRRRK